MESLETNGSSPYSAAVLEKLVIGGDLASLSSGERVEYYQQVCKTLGLNPLTKPFDYIRLGGHLRLYATKDASEQLRKLHKVSVVLANRDLDADIGMCIVDVQATLPDGRADFATGSVSIAGLKGDALANAIMKCETKAKRRVTLSICGLGWTDETELETISHIVEDAQVDVETGKIEKDKVVHFTDDSPQVHDLTNMLESAKEGVRKLKDTTDDLLAKNVIRDEPKAEEPEPEAGVWHKEFTKAEIVSIINERLKPKLDPFDYASFKGDKLGERELIKAKKLELASFAEELKEYIASK